jgi:hypothetical protein
LVVDSCDYMGNGIKKQKADKKESELLRGKIYVEGNKSEYDDDIEEASKLALAMQENKNSTTYELKLSCRNLP